MKIKSYITVIFIGLLALCGCTQNNGNIGKLFGSWVMTEMTVDGNIKIFPENAYTSVSFQNNVVRIDYHYGTNNRYSEHYGSWIRTDNILQLDFTHGDDLAAPGTGEYSAPDWLDMPSNSKINLTLADLAGNRMTWIYNTSDNKVIIYKFERTW